MIVGRQAPEARFYAYDSANKDRGQLKEEANQPTSVSSGPSPENNQQVQNQRAAQVNRGRALRVQVAQDENQALRDTQLGRRAAAFGGGGGQAEALRAKSGSAAEATK